MKEKIGTFECNIFFEVISIILVLISYILFVVQSFKNFLFTKKNTSKEIITERILYRHFSDEIYSNIKQYPICKVTTKDLNDPPYENRCGQNQTLLYIDVNLDTYFDCQGVKKGLLNEAQCQDRIVSNLTCCKSECCPRPKNNENFFCTNYNFDLKKSYNDSTILTYDDEERYEDPKRRYCKYYNKYSNTTSILLNKIYCVEECNYNYEDILSSKDDDSISIFPKEGYIDCGEIDTMHNHLFLKNGECPMNFIIRDGDKIFFDHLSSNNLSIIVSNILSEIPPDIHERKHKIDEEVFKNNITVVNYYKIIKQKESYYKKQEPIFFINELTDIYNIYKDKVNPYQEIYWYTSNYIGFKSIQDFNDFYELFKNKNDKNYLYDITRNLRPSIVSAVIGIILIILCIAYLILFFIYLKIKDFSSKSYLFISKEVITALSFIIGLILYIVYTENQFKPIKIHMDAHYKDIIDIYNDRRKQKYYLSSIIIMAISLAYEIYFISCAKTKRDKKIDKGSENSSAVGEYEEIKKNEEIVNKENENKEQIKKDFEISNVEQIDRKNHLEKNKKKEDKKNNPENKKNEEDKKNNPERNKNEKDKKNNPENNKKEEQKKEKVYIREEIVSSERNFGNLKDSLRRSVNSRFKVSELHINNQ